MILALTATAALLVGLELAARIWPDRNEIGSFERALYGYLIGAAVWLGTTWLLALTSQLRTPVVVARSVLLLAVTIVLVWRRRSDFQSRQIDRDTVLLVLPSLMPLVFWIVFALWRGAVIPPLTHDALSYHLPKAALYMRAGGYDELWSLQWLLRVRPANYEILLADALVSDGVDQWTEWISTFFYAGFVLAAVGLSERWWGRNTAAAMGIALATASVPLLLLHSSAHKNDVMSSFFVIAGIVATSRLLGTGELRSLAVLMIAFAAAVGTKANMAIAACCIAPFVLWRIARLLRAGRRPRTVALVVLLGLLSFLLLGGWVFVERLLPHESVASDESNPTVVEGSSWDQWENLWQGPYIMLTAPFSTDPNGLHVPWDTRPWFWRRGEIYFSHNGVLFSLAVIALPVAVWLLRRDEKTRRERVLVSLAVLAAFLIHLPVRFMPLGLLPISLSRFTLFIIPVVFAWTVAPALRWISERFVIPSFAAVFALALLMAWAGVDYAVHDVFAPLKYVIWAAEHPGTRVVPFDPNRVGCMTDRAAGPRDKIAIFAGTASWIYPAFGARLTRPVVLLRPNDSLSRIPPDAKWVVIDSYYEVIWTGAPFKSLGDQGFGTGQPKPGAQDVMQALWKDKRFEPVLVRPYAMQAIFRRR